MPLWTIRRRWAVPASHPARGGGTAALPCLCARSQWRLGAAVPPALAHAVAPAVASWLTGAACPTGDGPAPSTAVTVSRPETLPSPARQRGHSSRAAGQGADTASPGTAAGPWRLRGASLWREPFRLPLPPPAGQPLPPARPRKETRTTHIGRGRLRRHCWSASWWWLRRDTRPLTTVAPPSRSLGTTAPCE